MGYEDRDYFKSKPKFELGAGLGNGTKGLLIALIAAYVAALIVSDTLEYASQGFWGAVEAQGDKALTGYRLFVLIPQNIIPVPGFFFDPGHWKLLTHWLVAPGILSLVLDVVLIYLVGRSMEGLLGTGKYLALFIAGCVVSGLVASLVDPWLVGEKLSVIMGPGGGLLACAVAPAWIAPRQKSMLGWPLRNVVIGFVVIIAGIGLLYGLVGKPPAVISPTQLIWGAGVGAAYMLWLKKRGRLPSVAGGFQQEENLQPWEKPGYLNDYKEPEGGEPREPARIAAGSSDKQKLDDILAKISAHGIGSLSRSERKFLDEQSKKK